MTKPNAASEKDEKHKLDNSKKIQHRVWVILESHCTGKSKAFQTREESWEEIQHNDNEVVVIEKDAYDTAISNVNYFFNKLNQCEAELAKEKARAKELLDALENIEFCPRSISEHVISDMQRTAREAIKKYREGE